MGKPSRRRRASSEAVEFFPGEKTQTPFSPFGIRYLYIEKAPFSEGEILSSIRVSPSEEVALRWTEGKVFSRRSSVRYEGQSSLRSFTEQEDKNMTGRMARIRAAPFLFVRGLFIGRNVYMMMGTRPLRPRWASILRRILTKEEVFPFRFDP